MYTSLSRRKIKVSTISDLRVVKERCKYEVKFREQALLTGVSHFNETLKETIRKTVWSFSQKFFLLALMKLWKNRN